MIKRRQKTLSVAFDTWILFGSYRFQGYYVYAHRLLREFQNLMMHDGAFVLRPFVDPGCDNAANDFAASEGFRPAVSKLLKYQRFWRCGGASASALAAGADVLFSPTSYVLPLGLVPVVATIGDATPLKLASHLLVNNAVMKGFTSLAAKRARRVLTFSECSKNDLIELFDIPSEKVHVVYLSHDHELFNSIPPDPNEQADLLSRLGITKPYIFHHGTVQPRKNLERLIRAYELLLERRADLDFQLVLSGIMGWQYESIVCAGKNLSGRGKVIFTGPVPERELSVLVKDAALCVVPSLYEGFCLPMVEAMACGTVTIASNTSCLPEVSGNSLRYFDPLSIEDMTTVMEATLTDSELRAGLAARGKERADEFSWSRCARETLNVLSEVVGA